MTKLEKPAARPVNPRFSSGPCAKNPTWTLQKLIGAPLGRSHRAPIGKAALKLRQGLGHGYREASEA